MQCTVPTRAILIHGRREKFVHGFRVQFPPPDLCCRIQTLGERVDSSDMLMCFLSQNTQTEVCAEHPKSVDKVIGTVSHPLSSRRVISKFILLARICTVQYSFDPPLREPYIKRTDHCWTLQELRERPLHKFPYVNDPRNRL